MVNGTQALTIHTRHGTFAFQRVRLRAAGGQEVNWLPTAVSGPLVAFRRYLLARLSFAESASVLQRVQGAGALLEDALWRWAQQQALQEDAAMAARIQAASERPLPTFEAVTDVYALQGEEFVVFTDGICVPAQKPTREPAHQPKKPKPHKRHDTDVMVLPHRAGGHHYVCEGLSGTWSLVEAAQSFLRTHWGGQRLQVVAITDGASSIRDDLEALFGAGVRVILDWYHLCKRVYEQLSMAAHGKKERESWQQAVLSHLWHGRVREALDFLGGLTPRNEKALADLLGYLSKHQEEIIDYDLRKQAGKTIGSGVAEKAVDQVVGMRQKDKGMSWTKAGSRTLALLKVAELNQLAQAA